MPVNDVFSTALPSLLVVAILGQLWLKQDQDRTPRMSGSVRRAAFQSICAVMLDTAKRSCLLDVHASLTAMA